MSPSKFMKKAIPDVAFTLFNVMWRVFIMLLIIAISIGMIFSVGCGMIVAFL